MSKSAKKSDKTVCGIIMPISQSDDDHPEAHWREVKEVISEAIRSSDCIPQPVWEGGSHDIIQSKILQNIFENEIVVCDISTRNPNVMLEMGMRLTTKKPTLIIAEEGTKLPFDTGIIHTEFYNPKLQFRAATEFIKILSAQISEKLEAVKSGSYRPYMEAFEFETVEPSKVTVSSEERMAELVSEMGRIVAQAKAREKGWERSEELSPSERAKLVSWERAAAALSSPRAKNGPVETSTINDLLGVYSNSQFEIGDRVVHEEFGTGNVVSNSGGVLNVSFDGTVRTVHAASVRKLPF